MFCDPTEFIQGHLFEQGCGAAPWSLAGSEVRNQVNRMIYQVVASVHSQEFSGKGKVSEPLSSLGLCVGDASLVQA